MSHLTLRPAYGRDYKSAAKVRSDWYCGKDFCVCECGPNDGRYASIKELGKQTVNIRYGNLRSVVVIEPQK